MKKTGSYHTIFSVIEIKISKILQKMNKRTVFVYILGFIFYDISHKKTDLNNKYMI